MEPIVNELVKQADALDNAGLSGFASAVDALANNYLAIKTAQYVGIQGYWIRNRRCFDNCYRQKRSSKPKMSAQEIWSECQNEYADSINDSESGWEKYASDLPVIKLGDANASKIITAEDAQFQQSVTSKVSEGMPFPAAVYDTIQNRENSYKEQILNQAMDALLVAEKLLDSGHKDEASKLAATAENMVKEAGLFDFFRGGNSKPYQNILKILNEAYKFVSNSYTKLQNNIDAARQSVINPQASQPVATAPAPTAPKQKKQRPINTLRPTPWAEKNEGYNTSHYIKKQPAQTPVAEEPWTGSEWAKTHGRRAQSLITLSKEAASQLTPEMKTQMQEAMQEAADRWAYSEALPLGQKMSELSNRLMQEVSAKKVDDRTKTLANQAFQTLNGFISRWGKRRTMKDMGTLLNNISSLIGQNQAGLAQYTQDKSTAPAPAVAPAAATAPAAAAVAPAPAPAAAAAAAPAPAQTVEEKSSQVIQTLLGLVGQLDDDGKKELYKKLKLIIPQLATAGSRASPAGKSTAPSSAKPAENLLKPPTDEEMANLL